jgi:aminodeoxychorismate lyase
VRTMTVFLNGRFVLKEDALVSVFDRGFLYGDGLFETIRVSNGRPFRWRQHWERLQRGAEFLRLRLPFSAEEIRSFAGKLIQRNKMPESVLRISLSRGPGKRGYSLEGAATPCLVITLHPMPKEERKAPFYWNLITSSFRLPSHNPLALFKTCNKLLHIMARAEAETKKSEEALLMNTEGIVAECSSSNLFWIEGERLFTPPLESGILPGVTRSLVIELCPSLRVPCQEKCIKPSRLRKADGVFLTLSTFGIVGAISLDGIPLQCSPMIEKLHLAYREVLERETT